jgi:hypothetical protein
MTRFLSPPDVKGTVSLLVEHPEMTLGFIFRL